MNSNETAPRDNEVAFGWSKMLQTSVSGFAEIVIVQRAKLSKWFLGMVSAYFGTPGGQNIGIN